MKKEMEQDHKYHLLRIFAICSLCAIIYSGTLNTPFIFDDTPNIEKNSFIRLRNLDLKKLYEAAFKSPCPTRPLANISFALNYYFRRYDVTGYHAGNIIIHMINGILVYFIVLAILTQISRAGEKKILTSPEFTKPAIAWFTALLFSSHPLQTQSVTYIVQRMNSMAVMFYLLAFLLYTYGRLSRAGWRRWSFYSGCLISWLMAIGSKEIAVTLPLILFLYEWYFVQDLSTKWLKRHIKHFLVPLVCLCLFAFIYLEGNPFEKILASYQSRDFTMLERALTQFRVLIFYISLMLYPHPSRLSLIHEFTIAQSLFEPLSTLFSLMAVIGLIGLAIYTARGKKLISFCILWFFINLAIESSIIGLEMIFEHRLYLPMFGFALTITCVLFEFLSERRVFASVISIFIIVCFGTATYERNRIWQNRVTFWSDAVSKAPLSPRAHNNLGLALMDQKRLEEAMGQFSEALRIYPDHAEARNNLGIALLRMGRHKEAVRHLSEALRIQPDMPDAHNNLGFVLMDQGRVEESIRHFLKALQIQPYMSDAHFNLGTALKRQGRIKQAMHHFRKALQIQPDHADAHNNLGIALAEQRRHDEAIRHFYEALRVRPNMAEAHNNLGLALAHRGSLMKAIGHFYEAVRINPEYLDARHNLELTLKEQERRIK
jgi:Flp pilus assembly protein TadD